MSSVLLSKTDIGLKLFFAHNVRYGNSVTFRIWVALESLQYLDNHKPQRFEFCIECTPTYRTCQLYHQQVKKNVYLRRNKQFSKWCVSKVFQYSMVRLAETVLTHLVKLLITQSF